MRTIRRTTYWKFGQPITLAFIAFVADQHPEVDDGAPPAPPGPPKVKERPPYMTQAYIRSALDPDRRQ